MVGEETVYSKSKARKAIPNELGPTRCCATQASNQSADETRTLAFLYLLAMPLPR